MVSSSVSVQQVSFSCVFKINECVDITDEKNNAFLYKCGLDSEILNPSYSIKIPYIKTFQHVFFAFHFLRKKEKSNKRQMILFSFVPPQTPLII